MTSDGTTSDEDRRPLILVVDDSPVNRTLTKAQLARLGYDVHLSPNGLDALAFLADDQSSRPPSLVFLDWHMPPPDGLETARRMRELEARMGRPRLPIVALTAQAMMGDREQCLAAGMNDFLARPVRLADLTRVIDLWIGPTAGGLAVPLTSPPSGAAAQDPDDGPLVAPVLDPAALELLVVELGDADLVGLLVDTYLEELPLRIEVVMQATDPLEQRRSLHTLKTTSAMVGTARLAELATRLEAKSNSLGTHPKRGVNVPVSELRALASESSTALRQRLNQL